MMKRYIQTLIPVMVMLVLPFEASAQLEIKRFNPDTLSQPDGYSQVVTVTGEARTIFLGGKAGLYPDGTWPESLVEQSRLTFENIDKALEASGARREDVVDIQVFIVDLPNADAEAVYDDIRNFFPEGHKPTSMVIGVSALAYPGLLVEVNVTAMVAAGD